MNRTTTGIRVIITRRAFNNGLGNWAWRLVEKKRITWSGRAATKRAALKAANDFKAYILRSRTHNFTA